MTEVDGKGYDILVLTSALWLMVQGLRYLFPPLFETIQDVYGVSNTVTGMLFTALLIGYALTQFPSGLLADTFRHDHVILFGAIGFGGASLITFASSGIVLLFVGAVLIGATTGVHKTVAIPFLSEIYDERKGLALGVMDTIGQFGGIVAPIFIVAVLSSPLHWQDVFLISALISFVLVFTFYVRVSRSSRMKVAEPGDENETENEEGPDAEPTEETYATILTNRKMVAFLVVSIIGTFAWNGLTSFLPLYFVQAKGLTVGTAGLLYSLIFVASFSQAVTGWLSDTLGRARMMLILFGLVAVGVTILVYADSFLGLGIAAFVTGIGFHGFRPVRDSYLMELIPSAIGGGTLGIARTVMVTIGGFGPAILGFSTDVLGYRDTIVFVVTIVVLAIGVVAVFLRE